MSFIPPPPLKKNFRTRHVMQKNSCPERYEIKPALNSKKKRRRTK